MAPTVFDVIDKKLADLQSQQEEFLAGGGAKDFSQYKESCGVIRGLAAARNEVQDLARNFTEDIDD